MNLMMKDDKEWQDEWCRVDLIHLRTRDAGYRNDMMATYCENLMIRAKREYYESGQAIMSDGYYDRLEARLKTLRPDSPVLIKVGS